MSSYDKFITTEILIKAFKKCGLKKGDVVLVHSNISALGQIKGTIKDYLTTYLQALQTLLGKKGTIVVPAFFHEYERKKIPFDIKKSPVQHSKWSVLVV